MTSYLVIDWKKLPVWFNYRGQIPQYTVALSTHVDSTALVAALPTKYETLAEAWAAASKLNDSVKGHYARLAKKIFTR